MLKQILSYCVITGPILGFVLAGCATMMLAQRPGKVYVANMDSHTISVIDGGSLAPVATIDAKGKNTHDLFLTADGGRLFATNMGTGDLTVVDTSTNRVIAIVATGKTTHSIAISPNGEELWVNAGGEDHIPIVSTSDFKVIGKVPLGEPIATGHIWFSLDSNTAWVTSPKLSQVFVVDVAGRKVIQRIGVGKSPTFVQVTKDGKEIWGTNTGESSIYVIDSASKKVTTIEIGKMPQHLTFVGDKVFVTLGGQNEVAALEVRSRKVVSRIPVGKKPHGLWPSSDGSRIFVVHEDGHDMAVIDVATEKVIRTIAVGKKPIGVVVSSR